jgi:hypothetical protein
MKQSDTADPHHTNADERRHREAALDDTIEASFPASDPPSTDPNPDAHDVVEQGVPDDAETASKR